MQKINLLIWFIFLAIPAFAQDLNQFEKRTYTSSKNLQLPYRILFPENYDPNKKYPLILFLHGGCERGNDNEKKQPHRAKIFLTDDNRKNFQAIVVFPQCPSENYWGNVKIDRSTNPLTLNFDYSKPETTALHAAI